MPVLNQYNRRQEKWYLQSRLVDIPEIVVGYRDAGYTLRRTQAFPTEYFAPSTNALLKARNNANAALQKLRQSCASYALPPDTNRDSAIWHATLRNGQVKGCRLIDGEEMESLHARVPGERLGLLPAELVARLRAQCLKCPSDKHVVCTKRIKKQSRELTRGSLTLSGRRSSYTDINVGILTTWVYTHFVGRGSTSIMYRAPSTRHR